ncbi:uncharacterized protein LOC113352352 [Papaver somniferum]|uniref:uncharacterized protein LOC113352352 n=1 Tax=Papaver somniferum TaxID=3469 RepID=UPI000E70099D|nr:uncharacterized protein LOC113352352 [Papaver somniferum]
MCQAGRATMVKAVLNAVPMYQMSTYKIPKTLINKTYYSKFFKLECQSSPNSFETEVVEKISRMHINISEEDIVRWKPTRDGNFTVKSAYNKLVETRFQQQEVSMTVPKEVRKELWKMKVPHRVKLFIWKCLQDIVQTKVKIIRYNNSSDPICKICNQQNESLFHLLWVCTYARVVWRYLNVNVDRVADSCNNIKDWVMSWFSNQQGFGIVEYNTWKITLMVGCWIIWKERCETVFQNKSLNPISTVSRIQFYLHNFLHAARDVSPELPQSLPVSLLSVDIPTIYVDASYDHLTNNSGTEMVIFSCAGTCVGVKGSYADGVIDAEAAECMAIREVLSWMEA